MLALWCGACGQGPAGNGVQSLFVSDCGDGAPRLALDGVFVDWSGGVSRIFPDWDLPGLDFSAFQTTDGGTLADDAEGFQEAVRSYVADLVCGFPLSVSVRNGDGPAEAPYSVVYVSHAASPNSSRQLGEGEYDVCNEDHDDEAIIYGLEMLALDEALAFDEWVMLFGNVIAHEIGHLVGFGHVSRDEMESGVHARYVELMLAAHTLDELLSEQRLLSDMTNCPPDVVQSRRIIQPPTITCGESPRHTDAHFEMPPD